MRRVLVLFFAFFVIFAGIVKAEQTEVSGVKPGHSYIPDGTMFAVELVNPVNSKRTFVGEALEISVLENVVIDNKVVIAEGARGYVLVSKVKKAGDWGKAGGIEIQPQYVRTVKYGKVSLANSIKKSGDSHEIIHPFGVGALGKNLGGTVLKLGSVFLFPDFGPGGEAEIPAGTKFIVTVDGNVDLLSFPGVADSDIGSIAKRKINWTGKYATSRGKMILTQDGNRVTGIYDLRYGKMEGSIVGDRLTGQWTEEKSETAPAAKGYFEIKLVQGGNLVMKWRNENNGNWFIDPYATKLPNE